MKWKIILENLINDCAAGNGHAENMGRLPLSR
jgi:hypothetical protein